MAEKISSRDIPAAQLKHGDIIEAGGQRFLVRVSGVKRDATGAGLEREIAIQLEGSNSDEWVVIAADREVHWVGQINTPLPNQLEARAANTTTTPTKQEKRRWWRLW